MEGKWGSSTQLRKEVISVTWCLSLLQGSLRRFYEVLTELQSYYSVSYEYSSE